MNLHPIDWGIVALFLLVLTALTLYCRRFVRTVADFLAAGRVAGRYLLTVSAGMGGGISIIALWEMLYAAGLPTQWWTMLSIPVTLLLALTGFITYRFRQTRALTLAQFFEARYSRRFRFFAGLLCWISGVFNYGIFPGVTARFIIYFVGLPVSFHLGPIVISTFPLIMALYLGFALFTALTGGQISIMMADFFQGMFTLTLFVVLSVFLLHRFSWVDIVSGLKLAPEGHSMLNPFEAGKVTDFNIFFFLITVFAQIYNARSWQGSSGFNASARSPHEAKMAAILGQWRSFVQQICLLLIPLAAFAVLHHPKFAAIAAPIQASINAIQDPTLQKEMTVPIFLTHILPTGLMGFFAAIILSAAISCDNAYMHSWGSIFVQDVILPLRKKPVSLKTHLLLLRLSIVGVAIFGFTFSMIFSLKDYILMYFALTGAIYLGGAGAVIIGGLYWNRGTTTAAWTALVAGSILAFGGLLIVQFWAANIAPGLHYFFPHNIWLTAHAEKFPLSGQIMYFIAMLSASLLYVIISLTGPRTEYDMDKLLHRGRYALPEDKLAGSVREKSSWRELLGLNMEFTRGERLLFWASVCWSLGWWSIFLIGVLWNAVLGTTEDGWSWFWWGKIWLSFILGTVATCWLLCGGVRDAIRLFRDLARPHGSIEDDGRVEAEDTAVPDPVKPLQASKGESSRSQ